MKSIIQLKYQDLMLMIEASIQPIKLKKGDTIRVIAPARSLNIISEANIKHATTTLESLGLNITFGNNVRNESYFGTASIQDRVDDIHDAFADKTVSGILTVIGGYSSNQLLPHLDYALIKANPKILCGYSDITALQHAIYRQTNLICYSGPHFSSFAMHKHLSYTREHFERMLFKSNPVTIEPADNYTDDAWYANQQERDLVKNTGFWIIQPGQAHGTILGGNLGTLQLLAGSAYYPNTTNNVLFIEDVSNNNGCIDTQEWERNLHALTQQPLFKHTKALIIGRFERCFGLNRNLLTTICQQIQALRSIPIIANVDFGHTTPSITFPIGGTCSLNTDNKKNLLTISG